MAPACSRSGLAEGLADRSSDDRVLAAWDVRRGMSAILNHPWLPTSGPDAITVRGFIYDVDTGLLDRVV